MLSACAAVAAVGAGADGAASRSQTLLVPRHEADRLDFVDPGSGRQLAVVALDIGPRRIAVSPDGRQAAVLGCRSQPAAARLSIVDLEHPRELRRMALAGSRCPDDLAWFATDRVAVVDLPAGQVMVIAASSGRISDATSVERATINGLPRSDRAVDRSTVAVQQFLATGGNLDALAVTPVMPRAVCHACAPDPLDRGSF